MSNLTWGCFELGYKMRISIRRVNTKHLLSQYSVSSYFFTLFFELLYIRTTTTIEIFLLTTSIPETPRALQILWKIFSPLALINFVLSFSAPFFILQSFGLYISWGIASAAFCRPMHVPVPVPPFILSIWFYKLRWLHDLDLKWDQHMLQFMRENIVNRTHMPLWLSRKWKVKRGKFTLNAWVKYQISS